MQKKLFASLLVTLALICACALAAGAVGTLADDGYYEISTAEEMHELATLIAAKGEDYGAARAAKYRLTKAPGNGAEIGGLKIATENGWFAARPSGTEMAYKIYGESFKSEEHLEQILVEARQIVSDALKDA